ncbi:MAG: CTP synthase, partial [Chitinophagales bacterium]|nr:CTP synthase [Chitinophagales bacterium]
ELRRKLALFCNVNINAVIEAIDVKTIYDVPLSLLKENLDDIVLAKLKLPHHGEPDLTTWKEFLSRLKNPTKTVKIALVGKYVELQDAYKSILESFIHAGAENECKIEVSYIQSEFITPENVQEKIGDMDGILVAPGFGERGIEGKITAIQYVRENNIPFFGICLGMQCCVVEFARNVLKMEDAHSTEMNAKTKYPVIDKMEEQKEVVDMGGTMRLGAYDCKIFKKTHAYEAYKSQSISERHRHRYEFNNTYLKDFEAAGMMATGLNPQQNLIEIVELKNHPWFVGVQFHPELKSKVEHPHPLFVEFVKAAIQHKENPQSADLNTSKHRAKQQA